MKFFSLSKNHVAIMLTLFVVIFFGAIYFFIYIPHNEKDVQAQRFRTLQQIDRNIHGNIDNSIALMNNLLGAYHHRNKGNDAEITRYIRSYSKENFTLSVPEGPLKEIPADTGNHIQINNENHEIHLRLFRIFDSSVYRMEMKFSFNQFTHFLLPENVFDQYIVFSNGHVAYETFPSGISYNQDSLLSRTNGIAAATVRNLSIGGTDYKAFLQPVNLTADSMWIVGGLLSAKHYQTERSQLPSSIILLLTTLMLIIVVAFPWIKLYQMGSKDRLTISDGISSIVVSMLLMSLLFFSFFKYNEVFRKEANISRIPLATEISQAFLQELDTATKSLYMLDAQVAQNPASLLKDTINMTRDSSWLSKVLPDWNHINHQLSLNQVFWLQPKGTETRNWISDSVRAPHGNFKNRNYFQRVISKDLYIRNEDTAHPFYLDQVISWNTGVFTSVLSIPSKVPGQAVAAMSFNMKSLEKPVLPTGYEFAIIDHSGQVLYHSNDKRNLRENLLEEFSKKRYLESFIAARSEGTFNTRYFGKDYNVLVRAMVGVPYFIVILSNTGFTETRDTQIFGFTFIMLFLFFGLLVFQLFVVFLAASRHSFFKKQLYETSWVGPKISAHSQYCQATIYHFLIILLCILYFRGSSFLCYFYILLYSVSSLGVFLNQLFALKYKAQGAWDNVRFKQGSLWTLGVFILIIDAAAYSSLDLQNFGRLMGFELISFLISKGLWWKGRLLSQYLGVILLQPFLKLFNWKINWDYARSFTLMALTRLIITSGIPVAFFYIASYNFEQNINVRYRQLQYAQALKTKLGENGLQQGLRNTGFSRAFYKDSAWINGMGLAQDVKAGSYTHEEKLTSKILSLFHIYLTPESIAEDQFFVPAAGDSSYFYIPMLKGNRRVDSVTTTYVSTGTPNHYLFVTAAEVNYKMPPLKREAGISGVYYYFMFLIALILFFFIIYKILSKIFCFNLPNLSLWNKLDERILHNRAVNRLLFIIGLPGSGKLTRILEKIRQNDIQTNGEPLFYDENDPEKSNVFIADLIRIPDSGEVKEDNTDWKAFLEKVFDPKHRLIIVNHFEYNIQDPVTNRTKLNFLEDLMRENHAQIIILSTIHPVAFLDSVMDPTIKAADQSIPGQDLERWHVLLGHYRIIVLPLEEGHLSDVDYSLRTVYSETQQTHFLLRLQQSVLEVAEMIPKEERAAKGDELAFKLQVTSHYFYMYIWQSLTKEEKFLLYDLAEDNLVNSYDDYNLNMLLAKGVIIRPDGILRLFNKGFRNFILTAIGNSEAMKIKNHINDNGNWNKLKTPLLIVILAILTFLFTSQEEAYSKMIAYVAALAAGVPTILKLFSLFDKGEDKAG